MTEGPRRVLVLEDEYDLSWGFAGLLTDDGSLVEQRYDPEWGLVAAREKKHTAEDLTSSGTVVTFDVLSGAKSRALYDRAMAMNDALASSLALSR